ncbi:hypothetical protein [Candidatus Clostridium radicumherbarum]|uniref:Terminase n=1 Tax=Candidatus Clostridium radicumherbarum TaxID=3381662 RepID=A0ABW8TQE8_9CLOT
MLLGTTTKKHFSLLQKSGRDIDGAVATILALNCAIRFGGDAGRTVYDNRGILVL